MGRKLFFTFDRFWRRFGVYSRKFKRRLGLQRAREVRRGVGL